MALISAIGNLHEAYLELQRIPDISICHAHEIMIARRYIHALQNEQIHAADGLIYFIYNKRPKLGITPKELNPILKHIHVAYELSRYEEQYRLNPQEACIPISPGMTIIDLADLASSRKVTENNHYMTIIIPTKNYHPVLDGNPQLKKIAFQIFGQGRDFPRNMSMLSEQKIGEASIALLKPGYVLEEAQKGPFAQGGWLDSLQSGSRFSSDNGMFTTQRQLCGITRAPELAFKDTVLRATLTYNL